MIGSPFHHSFVGGRTDIAKCRCGEFAGALPVWPVPLRGSVRGNIAAPDAGESAPLQQHRTGASEEEDMRSIDQIESNRKAKSAQFDQLHDNMQKLVR